MFFGHPQCLRTQTPVQYNNLHHKAQVAHQMFYVIFYYKYIHPVDLLGSHSKTKKLMYHYTMRVKPLINLNTTQ